MSTFKWGPNLTRQLVFKLTEFEKLFYVKINTRGMRFLLFLGTVEQEWNQPFFLIQFCATIQSNIFGRILKSIHVGHKYRFANHLKLELSLKALKRKKIENRYCVGMFFVCFEPQESWWYFRNCCH